MKYYIGIDAGGTKTDAVLCGEDGRIVCQKRDSGCNPNDIGKDAAKEKLLGIILELMSKSPEKVSSVFAGVAGVTGFGNDFTDYLRKGAGVDRLSVGTDALSLLTGVLHRNDGACVISGTGSVCFVRRKGVLSRIGGWGFMLDGAGSGYDLGRDAIAAVLHEYDGLGEKTVLTDIVTAKAGAHPKDMIPEIYRGGRAYIASFADTVFEGCRRGDTVSLDIMKRNAGYISSLINTAGRLFDGSFAVALGGGILQNYPEFQKEIRSLVPDRISLLTADMPPVFGSVLEAVYSAGGDIESGFKVNFNESYKTFVL